MGSGSSSGTTSTKTTIPLELKPLVRSSASRAQGLQRAAPLEPFLRPYTPQFTTSGPTQFFPPDAPAQGGTGSTAPDISPEQERLQGRLDFLRGKQTKRQAKGRNAKGVTKKIGKVEGKLAEFDQPQGQGQGQSQAEMPAFQVSAGAAPSSTSPSTAPETPNDAIPLRDIFMARGERIEEDPAVGAALQAFQRNVEPGLMDRMALMGLADSSTAADAIADAQADLLLPLYQDALGREERAIGQEYDDFLRRQGLAEQALFAPLGQIVPSTFGQRSVVRSSPGKG